MAIKINLTICFLAAFLCFTLVSSAGSRVEPQQDVVINNSHLLGTCARFKDCDAACKRHEYLRGLCATNYQGEENVMSSSMKCKSLYFEVGPRFKEGLIIDRRSVFSGIKSEVIAVSWPKQVGYFCFPLAVLANVQC
ncbi:hypothetical protein ACFE04_023509 [Oxalis oulophora]